MRISSVISNSVSSKLWYILNNKCVFGKNYFCQFILLFSLFLLLFIGLITLFDIIYGSYCTISAKFYLYLQYFQQKVFNFSKISGFQMDPKCDRWKIIMISVVNLNESDITWITIGHVISCTKQIMKNVMFLILLIHKMWMRHILAQNLHYISS